MQRIVVYSFLFAFGLNIQSINAAEVELSSQPSNIDNSQESRCGDQLTNKVKLSKECKKPFRDEVDPNLICTVDRVDIGKSYSTSYIVDDTLEQRIHIGALFWADSLTNGTYKPIRVDRKPLAISTNLPFIDGTPTIQVEEPGLGAIRNALSELMLRQERGRLQAKLGYSSTKAKSVQHVDFSVDGGFSRSGFSLSGKLGLSEDTDSDLIVGRFIQEYYTIDIDPGTDARDLLENQSDIDALMNSSDLPVYVSSIKYGRLMLFVLETNESKTVVDAAFNFKLGDDDEEDGEGEEEAAETPEEKAKKKKKTKAYLDLKSNFDRLMQNSKLSAIVIGGSNQVSATAIRSFEDFESAIVDGAGFDDDSLGRPISYTLSSLKDGSIVQVNMATKYNKRTCVPRTAKYKVTLKEVLCVNRSNDEAADDWGNNRQEVSGGLYAYAKAGKKYLPHTGSSLVDVDVNVGNGLVISGEALLKFAPIAAAELVGGGAKSLGSSDDEKYLACAYQVLPSRNSSLIESTFRKDRANVLKVNKSMIFEVPREDQPNTEFVIGGQFTEYDRFSANDSFKGQVEVNLDQISGEEASFDISSGSDRLRAYYVIEPVN